jgi:DNA-directed RNA polymerase subunit RPC12/RpoP
MIGYRCSRCHKLLHAPDFQIGTMVPCQRCGHAIEVPAVSTSDSSEFAIVLSVVGLIAIGLLFFYCCFGTSWIGSNSCKLFPTLPPTVTVPK